MSCPLHGVGHFFCGLKSGWGNHFALFHGSYQGAGSGPVVPPQFLCVFQFEINVVTFAVFFEGLPRGVGGVIFAKLGVVGHAVVVVIDAVEPPGVGVPQGWDPWVQGWMAVSNLGRQGLATVGGPAVIRI